MAIYSREVLHGVRGRILVLDLSVPSIVSFLFMTLTLLVFSLFDLRDRAVPNRILLTFGAVGVGAAALTGHISRDWILHLVAVTTFLLLGYALFRQGAIGGADFKAIIIVGAVSPGLELGSWTDPVFEAFISSASELALMLLFGYVLWRTFRKKQPRTTPLIPGLLVAYLVIQVLAMV
jgi:hypothetical protein